MKKFFLRMAVASLLAIVEPALREALQAEVKVPTEQRKLLNKLGFDNAKLDARRY